MSIIGSIFQSSVQPEPNHHTYSTTADPETNHFVQFRNNKGKLEYCWSTDGESWGVDEDSLASRPIIGDVSAVFEVETEHPAVFWTSSSGLTYAFWNTEKNAWNIEGGSFVGAGQKIGAISAVYEEQRKHSAVFCKGEDGFLHYFFYNNDKKSFVHDAASFKQAGKVKGDISAVFEPQRNHSAVFFVGNDDKIHYFYLDLHTKSWHHDDSSFGASYPVGIHLAAVFEPQRNHSALFVRASNGFLNYWYLNTKKQCWTCDCESFKVAGKVAADSIINTIFDHERNHSSVTFISESGILNQFLVENAAWKLKKNENFKGHEIKSIKQVSVEQTAEKIEEKAVEQAVKLGVAIFDYEKEKDEELSISEGDVIQIFEEREMWWLGKNERTGKTGLFPANFVEIGNIAPPNPKISVFQESESREEENEEISEVSAVPLKTAIALCDNLKNGKNDEEMAFTKGDVLEIFRETDANNWYGFNKSTGESGSFRKIDVGILGDLPSSENDIFTEISSSQKNVARALFDFEATDEDEISFMAGTELRVVSKDDDGWWYGYVAANPQNVGYFPSNYVSQ